ncbi:MAG: hypothetical protein ACOYJF_08640, partial [Prevotella sp.]
EQPFTDRKTKSTKALQLLQLQFSIFPCIRQKSDGTIFGRNQQALQLLQLQFSIFPCIRQNRMEQSSAEINKALQLLQLQFSIFPCLHTKKMWLRFESKKILFIYI